MRMPNVATRFLLIAASTSLLAQEGQQPPTATQDPQAEYRTLVKDFNAARVAWRKEVDRLIKEAEEAAKAGKPVPAIPMSPPTKEFVGRAQELAQAYAGKDDAVPFLVFVVKNATDEQNAVGAAFRTLVADHAGSARIEEAIRFLGRAERFIGRERLMDGLATIESANRSDAVLANVHLLRGRMLYEHAQDDAARTAALAELEKVAALSKDEDVVKEAAGILFEARHLGIGCEAPDIAAEDMDGVKFKLSDYRGKVVLLDFWGFW